MLSQAGRDVASRLTRGLRRAPAPRAAAHSCHPEALEDRRLFAVELVSVGNGAAIANASSGESSISQDGRYVVFRSDASNLVPNDANNAPDIFRYDRQTDTIELVSVNVQGTGPGAGGSFEPSVSANGRFVGFSSEAPDLTLNDGQAGRDIFLRDMQTGTTTLVSVSASANVPGNGESRETFVSADGRYVAFSSFARNLVAGVTDDNGGTNRTDAFVRDMQAGRTALLSVNAAGTNSGNGRSFDPTVAVSANGQQVFASFRSEATDLNGADANGRIDVYRRVLNAADLAGVSTDLVSVNTGGAAGNGDSTSNSISANGQFVVFTSAASDLVANDGNGTADVFLRNFSNNTTTLLSQNRTRTGSANGASGEPSVSVDGNFAAFFSDASNIVDGDTNGKTDIFFTDLRTGFTKRLSLNAANAGANGRSFDPFVSSNGAFVSFTSDATDLAGGGAGDDIFVASTESVEPGPNPDPGDPDPGPGPGPGPGPDPDPGQNQSDPPNVVISPFTIQNPVTGANTYRFRLNMSDAFGLDVINVGNVTLFNQATNTTLNAQRVAVVGSGTFARVTYEVTGATWTPAMSGAYVVRSAAGTFRDAAGNVTPARDVGTLNLVVNPENSANLNGTMALRAPASLVAGNTKTKASASVTVTNTGQTAINGPVAVTFFVSSDDELDESDIQVGAVTKNLKLATGKGKAVKLKKLAFPANIEDGNYRILARIDSESQVAETDEFNNYILSGEQLAIGKPIVDYAATAGAVTGKLTPGGRATAVVTLKNNGNVDAGTVDVALFASTNDTIGDADDVQLAVAPAKVKLKPGASKAAKIKITLPSNLPLGAYKLVAKTDPANTVAERDDNDNNSLGGAFTIA